MVVGRGHNPPESVIYHGYIPVVDRNYTIKLASFPDEKTPAVLAVGAVSSFLDPVCSHLWTRG